MTLKANIKKEHILRYKTQTKHDVQRVPTHCESDGDGDVPGRRGGLPLSCRELTGQGAG